jgi:lipopolysaccharide/colanic/teichoic acid biosynthesis glycosyltransferase
MTQQNSLAFALQSHLCCMNFTPSPIQPPTRVSSFSLKWRQQQLLVRRSHPLESLDLELPLNHWQDCLSRSPVTLIKLDLDLAVEQLQAWADVCAVAQKPAYVSLPAAAAAPRQQQRFCWRIKWGCDRIAGVLLLVLFAPLLGLLALILRQRSPQIWVVDWRVGERGKLFRMWKLRADRATRFGRWLDRSGLDELPQLLDVVCGRMSLVGPRPLCLADAAQVRPEQRTRFNAMPGLVGPLQERVRLTLVDLNWVNRRDLAYLGDWSLWKDAQMVLKWLPQLVEALMVY